MILQTTGFEPQTICLGQSNITGRFDDIRNWRVEQWYNTEMEKSTIGLFGWRMGWRLHLAESGNVTQLWPEQVMMTYSNIVSDHTKLAKLVFSLKGQTWLCVVNYPPKTILNDLLAVKPGGQWCSRTSWLKLRSALVLPSFLPSRKEFVCKALKMKLLLRFGWVEMRNDSRLDLLRNALNWGIWHGNSQGLLS